MPLALHRCRLCGRRPSTPRACWVRPIRWDRSRWASSRISSCWMPIRWPTFVTRSGSVPSWQTVDSIAGPISTDSWRSLLLQQHIERVTQRVDRRGFRKPYIEAQRRGEIERLLADPAGGEGDGNSRPECAQLFRDVDAGQTSHRDVRNDGVELIRIGAECADSDFRVGVDGATIPQDVQQALQGARQPFFVIYVQDMLAVTASSAVDERRRQILCVRADHREIYAELRSLADFAVNRDGATVVQHESMNDGQAQPGSFDSPGGEERLEDPVDRRPRHANAGVLYRDAGIFALAQFTAGRGFAFAPVHAVQGQSQDPSGRHSLSGIRAEIDQNL